MKPKYLLFLFSGIILLGASSCSTGRSIAERQQQTYIRYNKVYEGNRIIYRKHSTPRDLQILLPDEGPISLEPPLEAPQPLAPPFSVKKKRTAATKKSLAMTMPSIEEILKKEASIAHPKQLENMEMEDLWALIGLAISIASLVVLVVSWTIGGSIPLLWLLFACFLGVLASGSGIDSRKYREAAIIGLVVSGLLLLSLLYLLSVALFFLLLS